VNAKILPSNTEEMDSLEIKASKMLYCEDFEYALGGFNEPKQT
jgi:hypothetical protein